MKNEMYEEWKPIPGYEGYYELSSTGKVRSVGHTVKSKGGARTTNGRVRRQYQGTNGYMYVNLSVCNKSYRKTVHRLIALAFIPNPGNLPEINHIDGDKTNNNVSNLEWCTHKYNTQHAYDKGLNSNKRRVRCIETGMVFDSTADASAYLGYKSGGVSNMMRQGKTCKGYHFEYMN